MNNKIKRSIAAVLAAAAVFAPISSAPVFSNLSTAPLVASAAFSFSGKVNGEFFIENKDLDYTLYFDVRDSSAKTAAVIGSITNKENTNITLPETARFRGVDYKITEIGCEAFKNQKNLTNITIPKYVTKIGSSAFGGCSNLCRINCIPLTAGYTDYQLKEIGGSAFMNCNSLNSTMFLDSVKTIGDRAFKGCLSITDLPLNSLESMGRRAFAECPVLINVDLSGSKITEIPESAFESSSSDRNTELLIKMPSTVKTIGKRAFYNVNGLRKINISHATSIGESAFEDCHSLKTVFTGEELASIGKQAFYGCDPMTYFVCKNPNVVIGENALGYAHQRNYTGKKDNFTLWGSNGGGNVKAYADKPANRFPYKDTSGAASDASKRYSDYEWFLPNITSYWGNNAKYYFNDNHLPYANQSYVGAKFKGICAGMATVSALTSSGYLSVSDYAPGYSKIKDIYFGQTPYYIPSSVKSYVTTVWSNTAAITSFDYRTKDRAFDEESLLYAEYINYGENAALFGTTKHAMVCFGLEYEKDASDKGASYWEGWNARLMIYDVNRRFLSDQANNTGKAHNIDDYVYVNLTDGTWKTDLDPAYDNGESITEFYMICSPEKMIGRSKEDTAAFFEAIRVK